MGQYFRLLNLDGGLGFYLGKLGEGVWSLGLHRLLLPYMVKYLKPLDEIQREVFTSARLPPMHEQKQSPLLAILPEDVLSLIFDCFGDTYDTLAGVDAACFALACQMTFVVGHATLMKHQSDTPQAWAGHRLILAGDYQDPQDVPACLEHMLPAEWVASKSNIYSGARDWPQAWKDLRDVVITEVFWRRRRATRSHGQRKERNEERISRGPWAGHRFDIVDISEVERDGCWKDISDELVTEVAEIYQARFPAGVNYRW